MPGIYFMTSEFLSDAKSPARDRGMPGIRIVTLPADKYDCARSQAGKIGIARDESIV